MNPIVVILGQQSFSVSFNFPTLEAIEQRMGKSIQEIAEEIDSFIPKTEEGQEKPSQEAIEAAAKNFRIGFSGRFISACTGVPYDQVPVAASQSAFQKLVGGFILAINAANGDPEKKEESSSSAPGPASTAGSADGSSTDSSPPNSAP